MGRPSISLCLIARDEEHNLPVLFESIKGCFDKVILVDTGSTDKTVELAKSYGAQVEHFTWINDFGAARNETLKHVTTDYWMWLDLDDSLGNPEAFKFFRDNLLETSDFWFAVYNYAQNEKGESICSFARERVVKTSLGFEWNYPVHEGVSPGQNGKAHSTNYATGWSVQHRRSAKDLEKDRSRNVSILSKLTKRDARLNYYYGKELFESKEPIQAAQVLMEAIAEPSLELHDRILGIQYACMAIMQCNQMEKAIALAHQGLQLSPHRAEFYVIIGDCYVKQNKFKEAIPLYNAAAACRDPEDLGLGRAGAIFTQKEIYGPYPLNQLSRVHFRLGNLDEALKAAEKGVAMGGGLESEQMRDEVIKMKKASSLVEPGVAMKCDDVVISCPPGGLYEWSEDLIGEIGMGGSEIGAIRMAREIHNLTKRKIIVFNTRKETKIVNGVEYRPVNQINEYMQAFEPKAHISWRHNIKITHAPTYVWLHDLYCHGIENEKNFDKVMVLSEFHKNYVKGLFPHIPDEKFKVTRNGINVELFQAKEKNPNKIAYASSPDRGLMRAIKVIDEARKTNDKLELHCFYGFDNMVKVGRGAEVQEMTQVINLRPWVKMHGNVVQTNLAKELADTAIWLYPANFLETFCCTAVEMMCSGVYPIARSYGGLKDVLATPVKQGIAELIDLDCETTEQIQIWAKVLNKSIEEKAWQKVVIEKDYHSWKNVAAEWVEFMNLKV